MERTANVIARVTPDSKDKAIKVLNKLNISLSDAIQMYLTQIDIHQGIPFELKLNLPRQVNADLMTKEEFLSSLNTSVDESEKGKTIPAETLLKQLARKYDLWFTK